MTSSMYVTGVFKEAKEKDRVYKRSDHSYEHYCKDKCWLKNHCFKTFALEIQKLDPTIVDRAVCPCIECILRAKCSQVCDEFDNHVVIVDKMLELYKLKHPYNTSLPDLFLYDGNAIACYLRSHHENIKKAYLEADEIIQSGKLIGYKTQTDSVTTSVLLERL